MKKYLMGSAILISGLFAYWFFRENEQTRNIIMAVACSTFGWFMGIESAEEYYETPQYVIVTEEAILKMAKEIEQEQKQEN